MCFFLFRLINNYKKRAKNRYEIEESESTQDNDAAALRSIQKEIDDSKIDLRRAGLNEDEGAGEAVKGLVGLNAKAKYLERTRQNNIAENSESANTYGCRFDMNSYKRMWIAGSDNVLYKKGSFLSASQVRVLSLYFINLTISKIDGGIIPHYCYCSKKFF